MSEMYACFTPMLAILALILLGWVIWHMGDHDDWD